MDNAAGNEAARTSLPVVGGHEQKAAGNPLDNVPRMDAKKSRQGLPYLEDDSQVCFDWSKLVGGEKKKKSPMCCCSTVQPASCLSRACALWLLDFSRQGQRALCSLAPGTEACKLVSCHPISLSNALTQRAYMHQ